MADLEDEATHTEPVEPPAADNVKKKPMRTLNKRSGKWLGYTVLAIMLTAVGGGIFLLQELRTKQVGLHSGLDKGDKQIQELLHQISGLQTELAAVHSQVATLQAQVGNEDSKFERQIAEQSTSINERIDSTQENLSSDINHIQQQINMTRGDLMVADAEYLLSVANQKLHLVGDIKAVLAALEAADQRLHDSGDPAVFRVREALAEEINILKKTEQVDSVGISAKLLVIESKVGDIPLFLPHSERIHENHETATAKPKSADASFLNNTLDDLKDLVTVRRTDRPIQAILLPEEVEALRQILLLKLEMARSALLRGDEAAYKSNLDSALAWLHEHFDHDAAITKGVIDEIIQFKALQIQIAFPDISKSLTLLRNLNKLRVETEKNPGVHKSIAKSVGSTESIQPIPAEKTEPGAEGATP